jgi:hypothetical protein
VRRAAPLRPISRLVRVRIRAEPRVAQVVGRERA